MWSDEETNMTHRQGSQEQSLSSPILGDNEKVSLNLPPPANAVGPLAWVKENLFSSPFNAFLTFASIYLIYKALPPLLDWALFSATWGFPPDVIAGERVPGQIDCQPGGACWIFVRARINQFVFGFYPGQERWRAILSFVLAFGGIGLLLAGPMRWRKYAAIFFFLLFPLLAFWLLHGDGFLLSVVQTGRWGGFLLTMVISVVGIVLSLPIGIALALGRRSNLPILHLLCVVIIEFVRGVPLITVLFMANIMLPLFLPAGSDVDVLLRVLVGSTFFISAYMAEVVRGGLQAVPKGQFEGAQALGLGYWQMMFLIILPQALRISIPGIVNSFIGFFKDTTLVSMVGLYDFLNMVHAGYKDANWVGVEMSGYFYCAAVYWVFCFSMSRYSLWLESKLRSGHKK